uniref:Uncharacterized protein n=1 Tax=Plectus sambesii TaxID=2011161 RepID=A0A914VYI4_9BILA
MFGGKQATRVIGHSSRGSVDRQGPTVAALSRSLCDRQATAADRGSIGSRDSRRAYCPFCRARGWESEPGFTGALSPLPAPLRNCPRLVTGAVAQSSIFVASFTALPTDHLTSAPSCVWPVSPTP